MTQIILIIIYILSFTRCMYHADTNKDSETAKALGQGEYIINSFFVSLIPVLNTVFAVNHIHRWWKNRQK